jgi:poly(3-hydroxybutyrate) depolymerase
MEEKPMREFIYRATFLLPFVTAFALFSTESDSQVRYRDMIFGSVTTTNSVQYGQNTTIQNTTQALLMDVYQPTGDTQIHRPLIIWIHGGSLTSGSRIEMVDFCTNFAKRGYVTGSIDYRVGIVTPKGYTNDLEAWLRAVQDAKAAVRFFRSKGADYGIDTSQIYIGGASAGSMVAVHMAFWNESEIPAGVDQTKWGDIEGTSGNPGHSSSIQGIVNYCGAIADTNWIQAGGVPVACFHGLLDPIVPPDHGYSYDMLMNLYGGVSINRVAARLGIFTRGAFFPDMGHGTGGDVKLNDSLISFSADFFYSLVKINTGVKKYDDMNPSRFSLSQNFPNPFNPTTVISYQLAVNGYVTLKVTDVLGREVATLENEEQDAGNYRVQFDGSGLSSGMYLCKLTAGGFVQTRGMLLLK